MKKKKKSDSPTELAETLGEFFDAQIAKAKADASVNLQVGTYLLEMVHELGQLMREVNKKVDETLVAIGKEMEGRPAGHPTAEACRLKGEAQAYAFLAERFTAMIKRMEEKNVTVH